MATENNIAAEVEQLKQQQALIVRAVRIALALMLLALAVTCVRSTLGIPTMSNTLLDLIGPGAALPLATRWVMGHTGMLLVSTLLLTALGLGLLWFARAPGRGIIAATVVMVLLFVQWQVIVWAMETPLIQLLNQLGEPPK